MKKMLHVSLLFLLISVAIFGKDQPAFADAPAVEDKLVVYTTVSENIANSVTAKFKEQTGITIDLVTAGVGELLTRIESEKDNPLGDVLWGCSLSSIKATKPELFEKYVSANNDAIYPAYQNTMGYFTPYSLAVRCLLVNTKLIGDIEVTGYQSLLNPDLKGKIACVDPSASSSGYGHLCNQLYVMGSGDPEKGWDYVTAFAKNLDGKLLNSSSAVWKGVCDGEYSVGLTYEEVALAAVRDGYPVKIVFPQEGTFCEPTGASIIANAVRMDNAKKFIDFITSFDVQEMISQQYTLRGTRKDLSFSDSFVDTNKIAIADIDTKVTSSNKSAWLEKFKDIFTSFE